MSIQPEAVVAPDLSGTLARSRSRYKSNRPNKALSTPTYIPPLPNDGVCKHGGDVQKARAEALQKLCGASEPTAMPISAVGQARNTTQASPPLPKGKYKTSQRISSVRPDDKHNVERAGTRFGNGDIQHRAEPKATVTQNRTVPSVMPAPAKASPGQGGGF